MVNVMFGWNTMSRVSVMYGSSWMVWPMPCPRNLSVGAIQIGDARAGLEHGLTVLAGADHHAPDPLLLGRGLADHRGARDVGAVIAHVAEDLDADHVVLLDLAIRGRAV